MMMAGHREFLEIALKNQEKIGWNTLSGATNVHHGWTQNNMSTVNHMMAFDRHGFAQSSRHSGGLTKRCGHIKTPSSTPQPYHYETSFDTPEYSE